MNNFRWRGIGQSPKNIEKACKQGEKISVQFWVTQAMPIKMLKEDEEYIIQKEMVANFLNKYKLDD